MKMNIKFAVLSTDVAVFTVNKDGLNVLITKATSGVFAGIPSLPGGLVKPKENTEDAVKRFIYTVLGLKDVYLEQLYTFGDPERDPGGRVVSVGYLSLVPWNKARVAIKPNAYWVSVKRLPKLAYDHNMIVKMGVKRIVGKLTYTNIVFALMPEEFTLSELQQVYEDILDRSIDKRNFRKKINSLNLLNELPKRKRGEANRPARLFTFREKNLKELDIL